MKLRLTSISILLLGLLIVWTCASWLMVKTSSVQFDKLLETLSSGRAKDFVELEVLDFKENLYGALVELKVIPTSALIDEEIENATMILRRINGPLFINREGIQLGVARWELTIKENDPDSPDDSLMGLESLFSNQKPVAIVEANFFGGTHFRIETQDRSFGGMTVDSLAIDGEIDFSSAQHNILVDGIGIKYQGSPLAVDFLDLQLMSESSGATDVDDSASQLLTKVSMNVNRADLVLTGQSKKIPFNLQSHGSIWVNNDTLSSDWQISGSNQNILGAEKRVDLEESGYLETNINLQFRDFLLSGFWQYLNNQSEVFSLLQQAEWAMEEVETPEQQDFLRSLFLDADRIKQSQLENPLKPLLLAKRSQLAANVSVTNSKSDISSLLTLGGTAVKRVGGPALALKGEASIKSDMLSKQWLATLDRWSKKQWFRRYETEFESDIAIRNERLLLNNVIMSVDRLSAELSQALTDQ